MRDRGVLKGFHFLCRQCIGTEAIGHDVQRKWPMGKVSPECVGSDGFWVRVVGEDGGDYATSQ